MFLRTATCVMLFSLFGATSQNYMLVKLGLFNLQIQTKFLVEVDLVLEIVTQPLSFNQDDTT